jgi:hypothetical protein
MSFTREEILSLSKKKMCSKMPTIDPVVLEVLETYPSFDISKFNARLKKVTLDKDKSYNDLIEKAQEKLKAIIDRKIASIDTNDVKFVSILQKLYGRMINYVDLNKFENPILYSDILEDKISGDIDSDTSYDYDDSEDFDCWDLAKYTHSDSLYLCLQDLLHDESEWNGTYKTDKTWYDTDTKTDISYMKTMKFLSSIGFKCWYVSITKWQKGYEYTIYDVDLIKEADYIEEDCAEGPDDYPCRYYVSFNYIDYISFD